MTTVRTHGVHTTNICTYMIDDSIRQRRLPFNLPSSTPAHATATAAARSNSILPPFPLLRSAHTYSVTEDPFPVSPVAPAAPVVRQSHDANSTLFLFCEHRYGVDTPYDFQLVLCYSIHRYHRYLHTYLGTCIIDDSQIPRFPGMRFDPSSLPACSNLQTDQTPPKLAGPWIAQLHVVGCCNTLYLEASIGTHLRSTYSITHTARAKKRRRINYVHTAKDWCWI